MKAINARLTLLLVGWRLNGLLDQPKSLQRDFDRLLVLFFLHVES